MSCPIEICNFNEKYAKKMLGGKIAPSGWVQETPRYPVTPRVTGAKKNFPSAQINFMNSCKKTHLNILRFSRYLAKTARGGGKIAPPHLE